ncbi:MAG: hypothetical protein DDT40_00565 [candidate division WS2 bacterium]|uniref:F420-non-reducing hydrogenase iron-sulfur subunit D domain-containing protein n=1 Tax=Psychracetigena formicireducens TaxID=2986056 RepID=A0A9E2BHU1_PSYF1|nr:hypothetical protein [Candidatus Psychracetigena formicireducens]MBT9144415.1 hypothetical protein [Candidatus Psychracetigena formicireducens]MBT9150393.1 hypothetical protein [Candidatus Psychracetigena formicireducens]
MEIVAFCCQWCSYAGADLAGTSRLKYPANIRIIKIPCSSRINPTFILKALSKGVDGVMVAGCHPGDCHYSNGNYFTRRRLTVLKRLIEFCGINPERLQLYWISAAEGGKFAESVKDIISRLEKIQDKPFPKNSGSSL